MKTKLFLAAVLLGSVSVVSAGETPCDMLGNTDLNYTLGEWAQYIDNHWGDLQDNNDDGQKIVAALRNKNCAETFTSRFFKIDSLAISVYGPEQQQKVFNDVLLTMGENVQHIPREAFQGLKYEENDCAALVAATKDKRIGNLLAKHLTGPQLKAIPGECLKAFKISNFGLPLAQLDRWHLVPSMWNYNLAEMKTKTLQYAPRTLVMLYFSDKVCGALDYEQLAALGSKITNPFLKGTRGISRTCLGAIRTPVWQALHDQGGTVLSDFLKDIPPTSFTGMNAAVPSTVSGIVKAKLTPKQKIEFDKTGVSNPCPFGLLDLPLENLATCDLDDVCKARLLAQRTKTASRETSRNSFS